MKASLVLAILLEMTCAPVLAQPAADESGSPVERVVVTAPKWLGDKPQTMIHNFVRSYAMASTATVGEIARWKFGICARTYGLSKPEFDDFVTQRINEIAVQAGVGVKPPSCKRNVEVVFTSKPQDFLDKVHAEGVRLLGPRPSHAETSETMRYAIQAWYATALRDGIGGSLVLDDEDNATILNSSNTGVSNLGSLPFVNVDGFRNRTGLNAELAHIYIVADTSKTQDYQLGAVADYVAMLALSQTQSFDACKPIPSITNLISPACAADLKPQAITDTDLAYLRAVYSLDPGASFDQQQSTIAAGIARSLGIE